MKGIVIIMTVTVIYNNHIVQEFQGVKDTRKMWRQVSKFIKHHMHEWYWFEKSPMRVRRVIIERGV